VGTEPKNEIRISYYINFCEWRLIPETIENTGFLSIQRLSYKGVNILRVGTRGNRNCFLCVPFLKVVIYHICITLGTREQYNRII
jgi:hypothetical protein